MKGRKGTRGKKVKNVIMYKREEEKKERVTQTRTSGTDQEKMFDKCFFQGGHTERHIHRRSLSIPALMFVLSLFRCAVVVDHEQPAKILRLRNRC